eukprot:1159007-Pelagomonas_calceolata.AAC.4
MSKVLQQFTGELAGGAGGRVLHQLLFCACLSTFYRMLHHACSVKISSDVVCHACLGTADFNECTERCVLRVLGARLIKRVIFHAVQNAMRAWGTADQALPSMLHRMLEAQQPKHCLPCSAGCKGFAYSRHSRCKTCFNAVQSV